MVSTLIFFGVWVAVAVFGFTNRLSAVISIGGGFIVACIAILIFAPQSERSPQNMTQSSGASQNRDYEYMELHKARIREKLKDPESAQFRNVYVSWSSGPPIVCGEVNAKNSFGGYGGFQRFISGGSIQILESEMAVGEMSKTWSQMCA